ETAIAAMSVLAEIWDDDRRRMRASEIAELRGLQRPFVAKILTMLSQAGLVNGSPGPGGGYALARHPSEIELREVAQLFEREDDNRNCPFGGGECGVGEPCPLHAKLIDIQDAVGELLHGTTFDVFRREVVEERRQAGLTNGAARPRRRESYRASRPRG
ncbi:MAG: Rrf2 family transcriptional regulator, partial [Phycisphaerales bacterium]|nr:Rrf2 family transcriptional regulator [Phycisphaerales bacterium]